MENRNFHTALIGGFRKKDVINYMAEEKRLQEELLEELRSSQAELEQQLEDARLSDDSNRLLSEDLQEEVDMLRQQLELAQGDLAACREARLLAEERLTQAEEDKRALEERLEADKQAAQAREDENRTLQAQLEEQKALCKQLGEELTQTRTQEHVSQTIPADSCESEGLRAELAAERQRVAQLESQLRQMASRKEETGIADQLWALCGKMERTIRQMERIMDGPYQVTCYPGEPFAEKDAAPVFEEPEEPAEEPVAQPRQSPRSRPTVSSLLQRVRGK